MDMDPPDKLQQFVSSLPLELKISIISWMVKINMPISTTACAARLAPQLIAWKGMPSPLLCGCNFVSLPHPRWLFPLGGALEAIAMEEFWKVNVFEIQSTERRMGHPKSDTERKGLWDDVSSRPFVRHLNLDATGEFPSHYVNCDEEDLGTVEAGIIEMLPNLYPKLESLEVQIAHGMKAKHSRVAWERVIHLFTTMVRAVSELKGVRQKVVQMEHSDHKLGIVQLREPMKIDGRDREVYGLMKEMLKCPKVFVRLS